MAIANLKNIDNKLTEIYANQVTTNTSSNQPDRSELLFSQMQMIAAANKMFINFKK